MLNKLQGTKSVTSRSNTSFFIHTKAEFPLNTSARAATCYDTVWALKAGILADLQTEICRTNLKCTRETHKQYSSISKTLLFMLLLLLLFSSSYPGSGKTFFFLQNTYTNSEAHPTSCSMGTGFLLEAKSAEEWCWTLTSSYCRG